jgi:Carboxypeptidase regulatory-like domain/TonB dependent receptor
MKRVSVILSTLFVLGLFLVSAGGAYGQFYPGRVTGTVTDSSGALVPGADVKLTASDIGLERSVTTNTAGVFDFSQLPLGTFKVTVVKQGFSTYVQTGIATSLDQVNEIQVVLVTGAVSTQVEVTSAAPLLQTQTDVIGGDFSSQEVEQLPLGNSDYTRYAFFLPGTSTNTDYTFTQIAINGSPSRSVMFNIDGSQDMDAYRQLPAMNQGGNSYTAATRLPPDAVEEISVETGAAADSAAGAGSINVILKSGANALHGSAYEDHRDASLEAHNFFENLAGEPKAHFIWNEWGGSLGGAIVKDKTFFFVGYDGGKSLNGNTLNVNSPSNAQIANAESLLAGAGITTPNPVGLSILKLYQPYNGPFTINGAGSQSPEAFSVKIDQRLGPNDLLTGRYVFGNGRDAFPQGHDSPTGGSQLPAYFGVTPVRAQNEAVSEVHNFSPNLVNTARVSYNHAFEYFNPADQSFNPTTIGLVTGAPPQDGGLPEIDIGAGVFENLGTNTSYPRGRTSETFELNDDAVLNRGKHNFQAGFNWLSNKAWGLNDNNLRGILSFDGTQLGNSLTTDQPTADLVDLLGGLADPSSSDINRGSTRFDVSENVVGVYATDTYQLSRKLTLIAGVRWDFIGVPKEDRNRLTNFLPSEGLVPVSQPYHNSWLNFSPRVALAYSPFAIHGMHTVIRAGYGIYYVDESLDVLVGQGLDLTNSNPGMATNPLNGEGISSAPLVSIPLQAGVPIYSSSGTPAPPFNLVAVDPKLDPPYVQSWNFNLEQEITPGIELQVGYVASKGTHIYNYLDANQPPPGSGWTPAAILAGRPDSAAEQAARPYAALYPQFGQISTITSGGNSSYNSLQVLLRTKNYHGLTTQLGYTWAHDIDQASETSDAFGTSGFVPRDSFNLKTDRGNSLFDVPQSVNISYVYQFPRTSLKGAAGQLANNWQLSGVITWHTGLWLPDLTYDDVSGTGELHDTPDCTGPIVTQLKNFSIPYVVSGLSEPAKGTFGTCSRTSIQGPGVAEWDFSVGKYFPVNEKLKIEFRADAFNFLNHPIFGNPNPVFGAETITGTADNVDNDSHFGAGAQRQIQLNLKFLF